MKNDWETFQTAYRAASEAVKDIIDSDTIPNCVANVVISQHLDSSHHRLLIQLQSLFVLGAATESALLEEFRNLGIPEGKQVFDALQSCQAKSTAPTPTPATDTPTAPPIPTAPVPPAAPTPPPAAPIPPVATATPTPPASAAPSAPSVVPPMRTMANDMKQHQQAGEKVYSSTQEAILREGYSTPKPASPLPPPSK